jgi:nitrous oxidase accessory protein NosD
MVFLLALILWTQTRLPGYSFTQGLQQEKIPVLILEKDDTLITTSCLIKIPQGKVISDRNGNGVIHIRGKDLIVRFTQGSVLRGAKVGTPWDRLIGIGISAKNAPGLRLKDLRVHGFKTGIYLKNSTRVLIEDLDASDNYRQRLGSTPRREDARDWLYPHNNDQGEWRKKWGAALYLDQCQEPVLRRIRVRRGQNGIILDRVQGGKIYDNDCSFLSGWGLALWRSSHNVVTRNAFDFCVRGYSHLVYNRGQDSAGILMFEQCKSNFFAQNSVTHGGDGFFGNSGKEALGQNPKPKTASWAYKGQGNRDNLYYGNDFSYAAAHGFEQTFAFGEILVKNQMVGNAISGIWGGYSQDMFILDNYFEANGALGYGLERGGINIEHGKNLKILRNRFVKNRCGIHLWVDQDKGLQDLPWVRANPETGGETWIAGNWFKEDSLVLHLRGRISGVHFVQNKITNVKKTNLLEDGSHADSSQPDPNLLKLRLNPSRRIYGKTRPVGARKHLRGRKNILMDQWGPWDHESPFLRARGHNSHGISWDLYGISKPPKIVEASGIAQGIQVEKLDPKSFQIILPVQGTGVFPYRFTLKGDNYSFPLQGSVLQTKWRVRFFSWKTDPRKDYLAWKKESEKGFETFLTTLHLNYGMGGPASLHLSEEIRSKFPARDQFGTLAETKILLPPGTWLIQTQSDDGIRVTVDGKQVINDWTWHGPTMHDARLDLKKEKTVKILVEHFELNGYAILRLDLKKIR